MESPDILHPAIARAPHERVHIGMPEFVGLLARIRPADGLAELVDRIGAAVGSAQGAHDDPEVSPPLRRVRFGRGWRQEAVDRKLAGARVGTVVRQRQAGFHGRLGVGIRLPVERRADSLSDEIHRAGRALRASERAEVGDAPVDPHHGVGFREPRCGIDLAVLRLAEHDADSLDAKRRAADACCKCPEIEGLAAGEEECAVDIAGKEAVWMEGVGSGVDMIPAAMPSRLRRPCNNPKPPPSEPMSTTRQRGAVGGFGLAPGIAATVSGVHVSAASSATAGFMRDMVAPSVRKRGNALPP